MSVNIPLVLYDKDNQPIQHNFTSTGYTFFLRSYLDFDIRVLSGEAVIYKVVNNGTDKPDVVKSDMFLGDEATCSYTLFIKSDCVLQCGSAVYKCHLKIDNVFSEELDDSLNNNYPNSHYNTLLTNYFLPTWEELEPAIFGDDKRELIKRMLIDFRKIVMKKGTLQSIELFFQFVHLSGIRVYAEFAHQNNDKSISTTIKPNTTTDWKTGYYHALFDNWKQEDGNAGLNTKNLPIRKIHVEDLKEFFDKLVYAIALADKYFTLPEQQISFFGMKYSSNIPMFPSMRSNLSYIGFDDVHHFRKALNITMVNYFNSKDVTKLIDNTIQKNTDTYLSEVKVILLPEMVNETIPTLMFVESELYDDDRFSNADISRYNSLFGNVLHLNIKSPNTYVEVSVQSHYDSNVSINVPKQYVDDSLNKIFVTTAAGDFDITVTVWDVYNNREVYNYRYYIDENIMIIDFETFNSVVVTEDMNKLTLDVSSPTVSEEFTDFLNYVLYQKDVPDDLSEYYNTDHQKLLSRNFVQTNKRYLLPDLNKNFTMGDLSETLPLEFIESWVDIYSYKYDPLRKLKLRIYDGDKSERVLIDYTDIKQIASELSDKICVTLLDINVPGIAKGEYITEPYVLITTTEVGLDISRLYDFVLVDDGSVVTSLWDIQDIGLTRRRMPVNYDYQLFIRPSTIVPDFNHYISGMEITDKSITVKSLFPRLINISLADVETYTVALGDVICCRTNKDYITAETDITWEVRNAFTDEVLFRTTDEVLKYRIEDQIIYTLVVTYKIKGAVHTITKNSMFSSFNTI